MMIYRKPDSRHKVSQSNHEMLLVRADQSATSTRIEIQLFIKLICRDCEIAAKVNAELAQALVRGVPHIGDSPQKLVTIVFVLNNSLPNVTTPGNVPF